MAPRGQRGDGHKGGIAMMGSRIEDRESRIEDRGSRIEDRGSEIEVSRTRTEVRGLGINAILDPRSSILDPRVALTALPSPAYMDESAPGGQIRRALERVANELRWSEAE